MLRMRRRGIMQQGNRERVRSMSAIDQTGQDEIEQLYDRFYEQYGKPLEAEHCGEYVAVSPRGETILGATLLDVAQQAKIRFGTGSFIYKVGERAVGTWR